MIFLAHEILSFGLVITSWWLAHPTRSAGKPYDAAIAIMYGCVGLSSAAIALFRGLYIDFPGLQIMGKLSLLTLFILIIARRNEQSR